VFVSAARHYEEHKIIMIIVKLLCATEGGILLSPVEKEYNLHCIQICTVGVY